MVHSKNNNIGGGGGATGEVMTRQSDLSIASELLDCRDPPSEPPAAFPSAPLLQLPACIWSTVQGGTEAGRQTQKRQVLDTEI